ncbi:MAG: hypothetical protein IJS04_03785 [Muribaculaceae bacterium]|nr:hypothetical protein [Muribaculaceae bacterium]
MSCCCVITVAMMAVYRIVKIDFWLSVAVCSLVPSLIGVCKEWDDSTEPGNRWDWGDIRDNEIGVAVGTAIGCLFWLI